MNKNIKMIIPICITLLIVFLFYIKRIIVLKYYPPVCNFCFFIIFFSSLFSKETVIQKIAKATDGVLTPAVEVYTRKLTYVWCGFTFINFIISFITVYLSDNIWMLYNGLISYILMGIIFISEYALRLFLRKKELL